MKLFTFSLIVIVVSTLGCSTENPLCTDNYCVEGEIYARSELADDAAFSKLAIDDSVILATLVSTPTPVETAPDDAKTTDDTVTLADIVTDVASNGVNSSYKGQTVTITAAVRYTFDATETRNSGATLHTHNEQISFFVDDSDGADDLAHLATGTSYTFTLFIRNVATSPSNPENTNIWSNVEERPTQADINIETVSMTQIVTDVDASGKRYLGKTVSIRATVAFDLLKGAGIISLATDNRNVSFSIIDIGNPEKLDPYDANITYTFVLYIEDITEDEDEPGKYRIYGVIAND